MEENNKNIKNESQEEIERKRMYEALKKFFKTDMQIKEAMSKLAPTELDDKENGIIYTDKMYKFFKETEKQLLSIIQDFKLGQNASQAVRDFFDKSQTKFLKTAYNNPNIQDLYRNQVSNMDEKLIEQVKYSLIGYAPFRQDNLSNLISKSKTVNELLHVIHSYIVNNENIMESMPIIDSKRNGVSGDKMTLYGEPTELSQKLFNEIPEDLDCGITDIISMQDRILMMIRDRGHALTIDIDNTDEKGNILVKYFVPKLCNDEMIKKLPGVGKISPNGAGGMFTCKKEDLSKNLFDFIDKVPTDADIPEIDFSNYNKETKPNKPEENQLIFDEDDAKEIAMRSKNGKIENTTGKIKKCYKIFKK